MTLSWTLFLGRVGVEEGIRVGAFDLLAETRWKGPVRLGKFGPSRATPLRARARARAATRPRSTALSPADGASCAGLTHVDGDSHPTVKVVTCVVGLDPEMWPLKVCTLPFTTVRSDQSAGLSPA